MVVQIERANSLYQKYCEVDTVILEILHRDLAQIYKRFVLIFRQKSKQISYIGFDSLPEFVTRSFKYSTIV